MEKKSGTTYTTQRKTRNQVSQGGRYLRGFALEIDIILISSSASLPESWRERRTTVDGRVFLMFTSDELVSPSIMACMLGDGTRIARGFRALFGDVEEGITLRWVSALVPWLDCLILLLLLFLDKGLSLFLSKGKKYPGVLKHI